MFRVLGWLWIDDDNRESSYAFDVDAANRDDLVAYYQRIGWHCRVWNEDYRVVFETCKPSRFDEDLQRNIELEEALQDMGDEILADCDRADGASRHECQGRGYGHRQSRPRP